MLSDEGSQDKESDDMELEEIITSTEMMAKELARKEAEAEGKEAIEEEPKPEPSKPPAKPEEVEPAANDKSAPNLNAWLKAFGGPKKTKKEDEGKKDENEKPFEENTTAELATPAVAQTISADHSSNGFSLPGRRTRKISTGSTISELSSFSQDPDSPRLGIDERLGGSYPAPYPSPLGASPIMASPRDEIPKPTSPYPMNGAIKVGFYQDTTTKSSPEKSCSPREPHSPYTNYALPR